MGPLGLDPIHEWAQFEKWDPIALINQTLLPIVCLVEVKIEKEWKREKEMWFSIVWFKWK